MERIDGLKARLKASEESAAESQKLLNALRDDDPESKVTCVSKSSL